MSRTIHLHAGIIILDPSAEKYASSITFCDGVVAAIDQSAPAGSLIVDLHGQTLTPGFIDSHLHLTLGSSGVGDVDLSHCTGRSAFERSLYRGLEKLDKNQWLIGSGWSEQVLGEPPTLDWVDCIQEVPVLCWRTDYHAAILNSLALQQLDLNAIENIVGGEACKYGIVKESALWECVAPLIPTPHPSQIESRLKKCTSALHADGITLVGAMEELQDVENFLFPLREALHLRIRVMVLDEPSADTFRRCSFFEDDPLLAIVGFKTFIDGTLGSRTAKMFEPYCDIDSSGVLVGHASDGDLEKWVDAVVGGGYAPVVHAIGDEAVGIALHAMQQVPPSLLSRIEHAQFISGKDYDLVRGRWFGVQPLHKIADDKISLVSVGAKRASTLHDWRTMIDCGANLSFGSDWPIAPHTPIQAMAVAIENGVTPKEALVATTVDGAKSLREPLAGVLRLGSYADATLVSCNPLECDWNACQPAVTMTIVAGVIQFRQEPTDE